MPAKTQPRGRAARVSKRSSSFLNLPRKGEQHEATILPELGHRGAGCLVVRGRREPRSGGPVSDAERILRAAAELQDRHAGGLFVWSADLPRRRKNLRVP